MTLRVALVGGPMYDGLYGQLPDDAEIVVHADHPTLNRAVAELLAAGERIDLLCTHSKYAPSQSAWLLPLDGLIDPTILDELAPDAVALCRFDGSPRCAPRNIDVRTLWWRSDLMTAPPASWSELLAMGAAFGFTGRESGLFGLFYELVVGHGGMLVSPDLVAPVTDHWVDAADVIARLGTAAPADLPGWHYDDVDAALGTGRVALAAAWPGGTAALRASASGRHLRPAPYPAGPVARVSYAGCHAWAVPVTAADASRSAAVIAALSTRDAGLVDAVAGNIPANTGAMAAITPLDQIDADRLRITADTISVAMITYPPLRNFPRLEDAAWGALHHLLLGHTTAEEAAASIADAVDAALAHERGAHA